MKLEINFKIVLLVILFLILKRIDTYLFFLIFIIIHELAHMVIGILVGFKPKSFKLNPLGVSMEFYTFKGKGIDRGIKKIVTYISGPMINFIMATIFYYINFDIDIKTKIIYTNILIGLFNLIPIIPLDGGKILKEMLKFFIGHKKANIYMNILTKIVLVILSLIYSIAIFKVKNIAIFILLIYLWYLYYLESGKLRLMLKAYYIIENESIKSDGKEIKEEFNTY